MNSRQLSKKVGIAVLLAAFALFSVLHLSALVSSPEFHTGSIAQLDEKKMTVMELTAATAAVSVTIAAIPGDATTPLAEQVSELTTYLFLAAGAIMLEKILLTLTGALAFTYLIPAACALGIVSLFLPSGTLRHFALKLGLFGLTLCLVIPVSLQVSNLVEETFDIQHTVDLAERTADSLTEESTESSEAGTGSISGWFSQIGEQISSGVSGAVEHAKAAMSRFVDAVAALLIVNCVIPILVLWLFLWLLKAILGLQFPIQKLQGLPKCGKHSASSYSAKEDTHSQP